MNLTLNLTYPQRRKLPVDVALCVEGIEVIDPNRATRSDGGFIINNAFGKNNIVPDVDRYRIHRHINRTALCPHLQGKVAPCLNRYNDVEADASQEGEKTLVIVLESPDKNEYSCNCIGQPIAPAQGVTGSNILGWLDDVLRSCSALCQELSTGTRVILSNPVQFQASLGSVIRSKGREAIRDAVWKALWNYRYDTTPQDCGGQTASGPFPIRDCFMNRLSRYSPNYIINACTSTGPMKAMKQDVNRFLKCYFHNVEGLYEVSHPSSWHRKESNRKLRSPN